MNDMTMKQKAMTRTFDPEVNNTFALIHNIPVRVTPEFKEMSEYNADLLTDKRDLETKRKHCLSGIVTQEAVKLVNPDFIVKSRFTERHLWENEERKFGDVYVPHNKQKVSVKSTYNKLPEFAISSEKQRQSVLKSCNPYDATAADYTAFMHHYRLNEQYFIVKCMSLCLNRYLRQYIGSCKNGKPLVKTALMHSNGYMKNFWHDGYQANWNDYVFELDGLMDVPIRLA